MNKKINCGIEKAKNISNRDMGVKIKIDHHHQKIEVEEEVKVEEEVVLIVVAKVVVEEGEVPCVLVIVHVNIMRCLMAVVMVLIVPSPITHRQPLIGSSFSHHCIKKTKCLSVISLNSNKKNTFFFFQCNIKKDGLLTMRNKLV